jgi:phage terminase small subunit
MPMGRQRSPNRAKAYELWLANDGHIALTEIARLLGVSADLVSKWKRQDRWGRHGQAEEPTKKATDQKKRTTKKKKPTIEAPDVEVTEEQARQYVADFHVLYEDSLTEKQQLFCFYYLHSFNSVISYMRAYGCSRMNAEANAWRLLHDKNIRQYIDRLRVMRNQTMWAQADDVVELYMRIAFADINQTALVSKGRVIVADSNQLDGQIIQEIKETDKGVSIKMADRMKALEWLANYFGLNPRDRHKRAYDDAILELKKKEMELKDFYG